MHGRCAWRWGFLVAVAMLAAVATPSRPAVGAESAVVIMYHRFGEGTYPSTNIRLNQFEAHLAILADQPNTVLPLPEIVAALKAGRSLPEGAVGITIDDAYLSVYTEAWPRLKAAGLPFTLFVATEAIDKKRRGYMTWDQIRELAAAGVTIGSQTATHLHMAAADAGRARADVAASNVRFAAELGAPPALFAYPYGEASLETMAITREAGFSAAFGQHSGVAAPSDDFYYLPRFAMNENYGDGSRFRLAINAKPLVVSDLIPADPMVRDINPPPVGFTVTAPRTGLGRLACYTSHEGQARLERLGEHRVEVRFKKPLPRGRTRLNCTLPGGKAGQWYWFGRQFYVK
jgi:peptidoglycan/xylan/chitin deacetylase (PgdA/CDA1 family)